MQKEQANEYKGYSLFNQVEDAQLRAHNRARLIFNILEDGFDVVKRKPSPKANALAIMYYSQFKDEDDKQAVFAALHKIFEEKGIVNVRK